MSYDIDLERLQYLLGSVRSMTTSGIDSSKLGRIALEVLIARRAIEEVLENKPPKKRREAANEALRVVKELERSIVQLYFLLGTSRAIPSRHEMYEKYITEAYRPER